MIKYCYDKWNRNKEKLRNWLKNTEGLNSCVYEDLMKAVATYILNDENDNDWDAKNITVIDDGDYQGTIVFLIPRYTYQPCEYDYLMSFANYGSCSVCDTLLSIQDWRYGYDQRYLSEEQIDDFMNLCKDLVCNIVKPYNNGWRYSSDFDAVEF